MPRHLLSPVLLAAVLSWIALPLADVTPATATPLVSWREIGPPLRADHALVHDTRRDRTLMIGGERAAEETVADVWHLVRTGVPHWEQLDMAGGGPLPGAGMSAVYDSLRDRVLVFGGRSDFHGPTNNQLWQLSLAGTPTWSVLATEPSPKPLGRYNASMILDASDRLGLCGGAGAASDSSVWILPLGIEPLQWQQHELQGAGPGPRQRHGAVYSAETHRMTVFGGDFVWKDQFNIENYEFRTATTWELDLAEPIQWIPRSAAPADTVPPRESGGAFVADRAGNHAWLITGTQPNGVHDGSVWHLDLQTQQWNRVTVAGGPNVTFRSFTGGCFVPAAGEVLIQGGTQFLAGGLGVPASGRLPFCWALTTNGPPAWVKVVDAPVGVLARLELDAPTGRLLQAQANGLFTGDVNTGAWSLDPSAATSFPAGTTTLSTFDPVNRRLLIAARAPAGTSELWSRPIDGPAAWSSAPIIGSQPVGSAEPTVFDAVNQRMLYVSPARINQPISTPIDTVHTLEIGDGTPEWVPIAIPGTAPSIRIASSFAWDASRQVLHMAGGYTRDLGGSSTYQLWTLDLSGTPAWQLKIPRDLINSPGNQTAYMLDPTLDRGVLFGGVGAIGSGLGDFNSALMTGLATGNAWQDLDPDGESPIRGAARGFFDPVGYRFLVWTGTLWEVTWPAGVSVRPGEKPRRFAVAAIRPNPAREDVTIELVSPVDAEVTVEMFDVAGRRVGEILRRRMAAGSGSFPARLTRGLAPGLYLVRASDGTNASYARVAVLH